MAKIEIIATSKEYVAWLEERVKNHDAYWYGAVWTKCTENLLRRKKAQYPQHYGTGGLASYKKDIEKGKYCGDCVNGAVKGAIWTKLGTQVIRYGAYGCPDKSADGLFSYLVKNLKIENGSINDLPEIPGIMLHKSGHVGVYVGNGYAIEFRGRNYGCVKTPVSERNWIEWVKLPWFSYDEKIETEKQGKLMATGNVNMRMGPGTNYAVKCVISQGEELEKMDTLKWVLVKDKIGNIGWVSEKFLKEV